MAKIHYTLKKKLVEQAMAEINFDVDYRRAKTSGEWKKNEELLKAYNIADDETKSKIPLFQAIAFEEVLLSKIDNSLTFKMSPGGLEDKTRAEKLNALRERDAKVDRWDSKDRAGKRHMIRYGRSINLYTAVGYKGADYQPNMTQIRPRNFHIDPDAGGLDIEKAMHLGWWGVKKTKAQLLKGIEDGIYDKKDTMDLINAGSNYTDSNLDEMAERTAGNNPEEISKNKKMANQNVFVFYQHFTHDENDDRYILLLTAGGACIRCEKWIECDPSNLYPVWTYASSPDDAEFWSIAPLSRVRRIFKGMEKSVNQAVDNSDLVNKPKLAVNIDFIRNLAQAKYGTGGFLEITGNIDADKAVKAIQTPVIDTPLRVFDKLQSIVDRESGVTAQAAGVSDENGVLGIYDGNQENLGDRLGLLNKEYSEGYYRFATLWKNGVRNNLTSEVAIKMLGINGMGIEKVTWNDLKPTQYDYDILIESTAAETQISEAKTKQKLSVLTAAHEDQLYNQKVVREKELDLTGFNEDDKRALLDVKDGSEGMLVHAYEDLEQLILGKEVKIRRNASIPYIQMLTDLWEEKDDLIEKMYGKNKQKAKAVHDAILKFITDTQENVDRNEAMKIAEEQAKAGTMDMTLPGEGGQPAEGGMPPEGGMPQPPQGGGGKMNVEKMQDPATLGMRPEIPLTA